MFADRFGSYSIVGHRARHAVLVPPEVDAPVHALVHHRHVADW